jgi:hypothetical protein
MIRTRKNIRRAISSNDQRGMMLVLCVALIPISMMAMLLALTRFEIGLREAQREQGRVQARLLAESALTLWQVRGGTAIQGELEGFGAYEAAIKGGTIEASGIVRGNRQQAVCFIKAETPQGDGPLRIVGFENRIEVRE